MEYRGGPILAIDQNTRTGVAYGLPGAVPDLSVVNFRTDETDDYEDIYQRAGFWLADRLRREKPGLIAIEKVVAPSAKRGFTNYNTTMITLGVYAIMVSIVKNYGIPLRTPAVSTWRATFLGKGGGKLKSAEAKARVQAQCKLLGWDYKRDDNAADAGGIWMWACATDAPVALGTTQPSLFGDRIGRA